MSVQTFQQVAISALALLVVIGVFVLLGLGQPIPAELWAAFGIIIGYFFGNHTGEIRARSR